MRVAASVRYAMPLRVRSLKRSRRNDAMVVESFFDAVL